MNFLATDEHTREIGVVASNSIVVSRSQMKKKKEKGFSAIFSLSLCLRVWIVILLHDPALFQARLFIVINTSASRFKSVLSPTCP